MKTIKTVLIIVLFAIGGGVAGALLADAAALDWISVIPTWQVALLLLLGLFGATAVHELGHLAAGLAQGSRFSLFVVWFLKVWQENGRIRVGVNTNWQLFGGVAATLPRQTERLPAQMQRVVAAGPLVSLATAVVCAVLVALLDSPGSAAGRFFLLVLALGSAGIFLATTIPGGSNGFLSDRARWQMLRRGGPEALRWVAGATLLALNNQGVRPREWETAVIDQAVAQPDASLDSVNGHFFAFYYYLDRGDLAAAEELLSHLLALRDEMPPLLRPALLVEAAYFYAWLKQDGAAAQDFLQQAGKRGLVEKAARARAETAVLLAFDKKEEAAATAQAALQQLDSPTTTGGEIVEREWLLALANATQAPTQPTG